VDGRTRSGDLISAIQRKKKTVWGGREAKGGKCDSKKTLTRDFRLVDGRADPISKVLKFRATALQEESLTRNFECLATVRLPRSAGRSEEGGCGRPDIHRLCSGGTRKEFSRPKGSIHHILSVPPLGQIGKTLGGSKSQAASLRSKRKFRCLKRTRGNCCSQTKDYRETGTSNGGDVLSGEKGPFRPLRGDGKSAHLRLRGILIGLTKRGRI